MSSSPIPGTTRRLRTITSLLLGTVALVLAVQASPSAHAVSHAASHAVAAAQAGHAPSTARPTSGNVSIVDFAFDPAVVTITVGSNVEWTNTGLVTHTTTSNAFLWNQELGPGDVFSRTFTAPGDYAYHCAIHPFMMGRVVVLTSVYLPLIRRT